MSVQPHWAIVPVSTGTSTNEPVSVDDVCNHMRWGSDTDDAEVLRKIQAARKTIEGLTQRSYMKNQFDLVVDAFPCDDSPILLRRSPGVSVESVWSYDTEGSSSQFGSSGWFLDTYSEPPRLCLNSGYTWPSGTRDHVAGIIRFTAGYSSSTGATVTGIPDPMLEAVRKLATELYVNRESASLGNSVNEPLPYGLSDLLAEYLLPEIG